MEWELVTMFKCPTCGNLSNNNDKFCGECTQELECESIQVEAKVKPANGGVDMDNCFYCGHRASELTQIRIAIKPPNTPNRWKVIGVACNTCNDKFISQIEPSRLSV